MSRPTKSHDRSSSSRATTSSLVRSMSSRCPRQDRPRLADRVEVGPDDGMPTTSFLIAENTLSAEKIYLTQRITELGGAKMDAVCRALATAISCG